MALAGAKVQALSNSGIRPPVNFSVFDHYLFLQNLGFGGFAGIAGAWFGHLWSLAVEEQFYLLAPLVVRLVPSRRLPAVLGLVVAGAPILRTLLLGVFHVSSSFITVLMPCRADDLAMGMLAAALWRTPASREWFARNTNRLYALLGALLAVAAALWVWAPESGTRGMQTIGFSCLGLLYTVALLIALLRADGPIAGIMRMSWLRELGKVSYCVYIIHIVVNVACHALILHAAPRISTPRGAAVTIFAALLTYLLAKISWIFFENPLLRRGHSFKY